MKKILSLIIVVSLALSSGACGKKATTPTTITEMFDGGERVWFYVEGGYSEELAYNSIVSAVFVTENRTVKNIYYNLGDFSSMVTSDNTPNPLCCDRFTLADFEGLSDIEILDKVKQSYGDASMSYSCTYKYVGEIDNFYMSQKSIPYKIKYNGDLDHSGNSLENEKLSFINENISIDIGQGAFRFRRDVGLHTFEVGSIIEPTEIKDKIYVGIKNDNNECDKIVTINDYVAFDNISYDDPNGVSEW